MASEPQETTPAWSDIAILIFICIGLIAFLYGLIQISRQWKLIIRKRMDTAKSKRRNKADTFRDDNGYSWDYVMVFKVYDEQEDINDYQRQFSLKYILNRLNAGKILTRLFYSIRHDEVYVKLRANLDRIKDEADRVNMKLLLDSKKLEAYCLKGQAGTWGPMSLPYPEPPKKSAIPLDPRLKITRETHLHPYEYIYIAYSKTREDLYSLYKRWHTMDAVETKLGLKKSERKDDDDGMDDRSIFRGVDRLKLIHSIIYSNADGCCKLDVYRLLKEQCMLAYIPLHDTVELCELEEKWITLLQWPWKQPFDQVKDYFGEKIGLYFLFLGHYTTWLMITAVIGSLAWLNVAFENNNPDAEAMPYYATFVCIWVSLFLESWKRKERDYAMMWGMVGFEEEEQVRPQFKGVKTKSAIHGQSELYFNPIERAKRVFLSSLAVFGCICLVLIIVTAIFGLKAVMAEDPNFTFSGIQIGGIVASILNAVQIQIFNSIYGDFAVQLNEYENHRTDTEFEDALISKTFIFQFVNSFISLFYIAFVKPFIQEIDKCPVSCMHELQIALGTIFMVQLVVGNITEVVIPAFLVLLQQKKLTAEANIVHKEESQKLLQEEGIGTMPGHVSVESITMSEVEKTFLQDEYHVMLGPFSDYAELVIQFGYTTMFVAAFPLASLMSYVNNYVEIRVDGWKLCQQLRRTEPRSVEDIGTWQGILDIMSVISVLSNSAVVAYTGSYLFDLTWYMRAWTFILMSTGILSAKWFISLLIPDVSREVSIQIQRQDYITDKVVKMYKDEEDEEGNLSYKNPPNYAVRGFDDDPM